MPRKKAREEAMKMSTPTIFERKEVKYFVTNRQRAMLQDLMDEHMCPDSFGRATIMNIYYDTEDKQLIRHSLEKPVYKEKLRVRSYGVAKPDTKVFVELKKKYNGIVYKRRVSMSQYHARLWLEENAAAPTQTQITQEIDYFSQCYSLQPSVLLSYQREAYFGKEDSNFRLTFDHTILWRDYDISLCSGAYGNELLPQGVQLLEVKSTYGMPLWLSKFFSEHGIYSTSYSKYGSAYKAIRQNDIVKRRKHSA